MRIAVCIIDTCELNLADKMAIGLSHTMFAVIWKQELPSYSLITQYLSIVTINTMTNDNLANFIGVRKQ